MRELQGIKVEYNLYLKKKKSYLLVDPCNQESFGIMTMGKSNRVDREALLSEWRGTMKDYYRRSSSQDSEVIIEQRA